MIPIFKKMDDKMKNVTEELEYINKSQMVILKLNNAKTEDGNSRGC